MTAPTTPDGTVPGPPVPSGTNRISFTAHGKPVTQGSIRSLGKGRPSIHANADTLRPWREAIGWQAQCAMRDAGMQRFEGPVVVECCFAFDKPKSAPKTRITWPITRSTGDLDKLQRALLDALVAAGVMRDDSQVVEIQAWKCWTGEEIGLDTPGMACSVQEVPRA